MKSETPLLRETSFAPFLLHGSTIPLFYQRPTSLDDFLPWRTHRRSPISRSFFMNTGLACFSSNPSILDFPRLNHSFFNPRQRLRRATAIHSFDGLILTYSPLLRHSLHSFADSWRFSSNGGWKEVRLLSRLLCSVDE